MSPFAPIPTLPPAPLLPGPGASTQMPTPATLGDEVPIVLTDSEAAPLQPRPRLRSASFKAPPPLLDLPPPKVKTHTLQSLFATDSDNNYDGVIK